MSYKCDHTRTLLIKINYRSTLSVNTVDTLYAAFPMFMYLNPELGGYALSPLLEYQDSVAYTLPYAAKNIGIIPPQMR